MTEACMLPYELNIIIDKIQKKEGFCGGHHHWGVHPNWTTTPLYMSAFCWMPF